LEQDPVRVPRRDGRGAATVRDGAPVDDAQPAGFQAGDERLQMCRVEADVVHSLAALREEPADSAVCASGLE